MKLSNKILIAFFVMVLIFTFLTMLKIKSIQADYKENQTVGNKSWITEEYPLQEFTQLQVGHHFEVNWHIGDPKVSVKIEENLKPYIKINQESQNVKIEFDSSLSYESNGKIQLDVYSSSLSRIQLEEFVRFSSLDTLKSTYLELELADHSRADFMIQSDTLHIHCYDFSKVDLTGTSNITRIRLNDHTNLEAKDFEMNRVDIDMNDFTKAVLRINQHLKAHCTDHSKLKYRGDSVLAEIQQRDFSKVSKED